MPRTYAWTASVWQGDVDPFGELHATTLLRFLQETAQRASADAGYDNAYYARTDRMWLVRRTTVRFLTPITYGHTMEARTWVADFRRVRSQRDYEILVDGQVVTTASTDWVFADQSRGRPRRIPDEMETTFHAEGGEGNAGIERDPFPTSAPSPTAARFARRVEAHELDNLNHVNNANYARYVEEAALDTVTALDWPLARQLDAGGRLRRIEHDFEYLTAAVYGDALAVVAWPEAIDAHTVDLSTWITRDDAARPLLRARSRYTWQPTTERPDAAMPEPLQLALATQLV